MDVMIFPSTYDWRSGCMDVSDVVTFYAGGKPAYRLGEVLVCRFCGCEDTSLIQPGTRPHALRASCTHCGEFLQWVSNKTPAEREAQRLKARQYGPAAENHRVLLMMLGYTVDKPMTIQEASDLIERLEAVPAAKRWDMLG